MKSKIINILLIVVFIIISVIEGFLLINKSEVKTKDVKDYLKYSNLILKTTVLDSEKKPSFTSETIYILDDKDWCFYEIESTQYYNEESYYDMKKINLGNNKKENENLEKRIITEDDILKRTFEFDDDNLTTKKVTRYREGSYFSKDSIIENHPNNNEYIIYSYELY